MQQNTALLGSSIQHSYSGDALALHERRIAGECSVIQQPPKQPVPSFYSQTITAIAMSSQPSGLAVAPQVKRVLQ